MKRWEDEWDDINRPGVVLLVFRCDACDRRFWAPSNRDQMHVLADAGDGEVYPAKPHEPAVIAALYGLCGHCWNAYREEDLLPPSQYIDPPPGEDG